VSVDPACWRGDDPAIGDRLARRFSSAERSALTELAARLHSRPANAATAAEFSAPALAPLIRELRHAVMHGAGAMILAGLDADALPAGALDRIFWGLGTRIGTASIQSPAGEWIARVEQCDDNPEGRGTLTDAELRPHTDMHEVLALACIREAAEGGESLLVSAAALHEAVGRRSPAALAALEQGYYAGINEAVGSDRPVSAEKVPVFSTTGGKLSCCYNRFFMQSAAKLRGEALPADLAAALAILDEEASRPGLGFRFRLRPGDMAFWHNWTCLHARTAFRDEGANRRLLLRLWLNVAPGRPVDPRVAARAAAMDADHRAAQAGRRAA
jgi:hypothetical protein